MNRKSELNYQLEVNGRTLEIMKKDEEIERLKQGIKDWAKLHALDYKKIAKAKDLLKEWEKMVVESWYGKDLKIRTTEFLTDAKKG